jgi:hypothetical protein
VIRQIAPLEEVDHNRVGGITKEEEIEVEEVVVDIGEEEEDDHHEPKIIG